MNARELFDDGVKWTDFTARAAFPILISRAVDGDTITYGDLNRTLKEFGHKGAIPITYKSVAGKIGDICDALNEDLGDPVPPLNAIIVSSSSGLPSHGADTYVSRFLGKDPNLIEGLSEADRDAYARQAIDAVHSYDGWDQVRIHLGFDLLDVGLGRLDRGEPIARPDIKRFATGPESEAHKALKAWVADNPAFFRNYGKFVNGLTEQPLSSGDRLDVLFDKGGQMLAVEVKAHTASEAEVERGIYQCIKYRATIRAMQIAASRPPNGNAVLVLGRTPHANAVHLARRLFVRIMLVNPL